MTGVRPPYYAPMEIEDSMSREWREYFARINNIVSSMTAGSTARLVRVDAYGNLERVDDLTDWIAGTSQRVTVTDDSDGSVTLSLPDLVSINALQLALNATSKTGNYTLTTDDTFVRMNAGSGAYSGSFPVTRTSEDGCWNAGGFDSTQVFWGDAFGTYQRAFLLFPNVTIPQGAVIVSAYLQVYMYGYNYSSGLDWQTDIFFNDEDNATVPTDAATANAKTKTTAYTAWDFTTNPAPPAGSYNLVNSPSVRSVVQEVVDRASWASNNDMMALLYEGGGVRDLTIKDYGADSTKAAKLYATWNTSVPTVTIPSDIISDNPGKLFFITKTDSSSYQVEIVTEGGETINGALSLSLYNQYDTAVLWSDGSNIQGYVLFAALTESLMDYVTTLISDIPTVGNILDKTADETVSGSWTFTQKITGSADEPTTGNDLANKAYVDKNFIKEAQVPEAGTESGLHIGLLHLDVGGAIKPVDRSSGVIVETATVTNTAVETEIFREEIPADSLKVGDFIKVYCSGTITNATAADDLTIKGYLGSTLLGSFSTAIGNLTDKEWHVESNMTVRATGGSGQVVWAAHFHVHTFEEAGTGVIAVDTTINNDFTITIQWDNAKAGNTISAYQGILEFKGE